MDELTAEGLWPGREGRLPLGLAALASKAWEPRPAAEWLRKGLPNAGVRAPGGVSTPSLGGKQVQSRRERALRKTVVKKTPSAGRGCFE